MRPDRQFATAVSLIILFYFFYYMLKVVEVKQ